MSQGLWLNGGTRNEIKNNILSIKKGGYPASITAGTSGFSLDYNDYYNPSGTIIKYNDVEYSTLLDWQQVTGQDSHSVSEPPFYTTDSDLQMNQVLLNNMGTHVPGIIYDIDGTLRHTTHPDMGAKEYDPCNPDAGINRVTAPLNPAPKGKLDVKVILQNQGNASLNSVLINWMVNDELQNPYTWTGNLPVKGNVEVTIGNYNFEGGIFQLKVWTSQPNGASECNKNNDTCSVKRATPLCGNYTIGGNNPDFANFTEAVNMLNLAGISCPVVFFVRDGGYTDHPVFNKIAGTSPTNTITFKSESGDSTAVLMNNVQYPNASVKLNNASYINFIGIGFTGWGVYQRGLNGAGIPVQGVLFDIEGEIRNDQAPDIGCDEFMVDFGITQVISPSNDCRHSATDSLTVLLRQFGDVPFTNIILAAQLDNQPVMRDTIVGTVYNDMVFTFPKTVNISNQGSYTIKCWLVGNSDDNINNDTITVKRSSYPAPKVDFAYQGNKQNLLIQFTGTASIDPPYSVSSFEWLFGDGDTAKVRETSHIYKNSGTFLVIFRAYNNMGCYSEVSKQVTVEQYEVLQLTVSSKNSKCSDVCSGEIQITASGGTSPLTLYLDNKLITAKVVSNVCARKYTVKAVDAASLSKTAEATIITESPVSINIVADKTEGNIPLEVKSSCGRDRSGCLSMVLQRYLVI